MKVQLTRAEQKLIAMYEAGKEAGKKAARRETPFKLTERRLSCMADLSEHVEQLRDELERLRKIEQTQSPLDGHASRDISVYYGVRGRMSETEKLDALIKAKQEELEGDEYEIKRLTDALEKIRNSYWWPFVEGHYLTQPQKSDEDIAAALGIELTTTAYRQRNKLVERVSVLLYGSAAMQ